ncbi:hypothetical protein NDU88_002526 [Pleurodeles waltl]|uniref:Uncharacterized protein n=1 Tax=Pleurodeles waltl TaxID=8319 RepID=A0AAV7W235_PLEWA|nr:hypothetical protein NDU88_002526 [Pleurodeles waltl]
MGRHHQIEAILYWKKPIDYSIALSQILYVSRTLERCAGVCESRCPVVQKQYQKLKLRDWYEMLSPATARACVP